jgi:hypothetical protein
VFTFRESFFDTQTLQSFCWCTACWLGVLSTTGAALLSCGSGALLEQSGQVLAGLQRVSCVLGCEPGAWALLVSAV